MNDLIVWRDKLQELYAMKSIYIDKAVQFVLALVTFLMINQNIGLMKAVATPVVAVALAVICTFLPPVVTAYVAAGLVIVHLFKLSIGVAAAAALIFVVMFIFYCRFTPKKALLLLVTPVAFMLHVPYVVPIACALVLGPISAVPVVFGTIIYYMIECVRTSATAITSADGITRQISLFVKTVFQDKTLWITVIAFIISIFVVYTVRRLSVDHAWKIAAASGAVAPTFRPSSAPNRAASARCSSCRMRSETGTAPRSLQPPLHPGWTKPGFPPTSTSGPKIRALPRTASCCWSRYARWINTACGSGPARSLPRTSAGWTRRWM